MFLIILGYFTLLSALAFFMMRIDKQQARKRGQRIPEKNLWSIAIAGGGIGAYLGMMMFRHKTKHTNFRVGFLLLAAIDVAVILWSYQTF
jgi:uncharacterized membrane protein YsdA (DUF1294 family)